MIVPGTGTITTFLDNAVGRIPSVRPRGILRAGYGAAFDARGVGAGYSDPGDVFRFGAGHVFAGQIEGIVRGLARAWTRRSSTARRPAPSVSLTWHDVGVRGHSRDALLPRGAVHVSSS